MTETVIEIDLRACERVADVLRGRPISPDAEESSLPGFSREQAGNFYLLLVAICHQTSPLGRPPLEGEVDGRPRKGWDYLSARLEQAVRADGTLLTTGRWASLSGDEVRTMFRDPSNGDRLTDPPCRAALVNDLGATMDRYGWSHLQQLYVAGGGRADRLLDLLSRFRAYRDPVRKKSLFLLSLMRNAGIWTYPDPENLGPPVDYHEVRGHLRLGTVRVLNVGLDARLRAAEPVTAAEDEAIRRSVHDAIVRVAQLLEVTPSQMHYLFWNVFRSCCPRDLPHCGGCPVDCRLVATYRHLGEGEGGARRCPFSGVCPSARAERRYIEHVHDTDYY